MQKWKWTRARQQHLCVLDKFDWGFNSAIPTQFYNPVTPRVIFGIRPPAHTFNSEFAFKSRIPSVEKSGNPGSRKTFWPPQLAGSTFLPINTLACPTRSTQYSQGQTIRACARAVGPGKRQKGQRFNHINARKSWYGLEGDGPNSSSQKQGLSGLTSGHDERILPSRGFPRWLRKRKGVHFLIS